MYDKQIQPTETTAGAAAAAVAKADDDGDGGDDDVPRSHLVPPHLIDDNAAAAGGAVGGASSYRISVADASGAAPDEVLLDDAVVFVNIYRPTTSVADFVTLGEAYDRGAASAVGFQGHVICCSER